MSEPPGVGPGPPPSSGSASLLDLYDTAMPQVFRYLHRRCGSISVAEDLTAETFLAAVNAVRLAAPPDLTEAWLLSVARNKLVDHWRRLERVNRLANELGPLTETEVDDWDIHLDALIAHEVLAGLGPHHQSALALRYLDGLTVQAVATALGRTVGATEVLLVRARRAFRQSYEQRPGGPVQ